jgi:hypothetical protein
MVLRPTTILLSFCAIAFFGIAELGSRCRAEGNASARTTLYANDREHLWNRLHKALMIRQGPDKRFYGEDRLEPLLWNESDHLLKGNTAERCVALLEEFLGNQGESRIDLPLKRAILQRDLWLVANWLHGKASSEASRKLEILLARAIKRLALTREQIGKLPDNYTEAIHAQAFPDRFAPNRPDQSYLPPDLFRVDGPWIGLGDAKAPTAPRHLLDGSNPFTNSTFLIFLKLPGGRGATLRFLKELAALKEPLFIANGNPNLSGSFPYLPQPKIPAWPKGTEIALVRRALLIDSTFRVIASPLTESVQIRVIKVKTPELTAEILERVSRRNAHDWHAAFEFQLRRRDLFEGKNGGLRDVSAEGDFKTGFNAHPWDEFARDYEPGEFPTRSQPFKKNRDSCITCHNFPGVYSFNSLGQIPSSMRDQEEMTRLAVMRVPVIRSVAEVERAAMNWKEKQSAWKSLAAQFQK